MEKKVLKLVAVMVLGMLTVVISGCATDRVQCKYSSTLKSLLINKLIFRN